MKALSIRQPWAWLLVHGHKDIENRDWVTGYRGRLLLHAGKGMTRDDYEECARFAVSCGVIVPPAAELPRGGIVGVATLVDCVRESASQWFFGRYGFLMRDAAPLPFTPIRGALNLFEVPDALFPDAAA